MGSGCFLACFEHFFPYLRVYSRTSDVIILLLETGRDNRRRPPAGKGAPARENTQVRTYWIWI